MFMNLFKKKSTTDTTPTIQNTALKTNLQKIKDFELEMERKYNLTGKIDFHLLRNEFDKKSKGCFMDGKYYIEVGMKDYENLESLTDKQWNHIYNTITHELIHGRNYYNLSSDTQNKLHSNIRTIAHWARLVLEEYSAYKEANELFPETVDELNCTEEKIFEAFEHMYSIGIFNKPSPQELYIAFYDYCSALIVHSIVGNEFPRNKEKNRDYNRACNDFIKDLKETYSKMPLNYDEYKVLGEILLSDLMFMVPVERRNIFKANTNIKFNH